MDGGATRGGSGDADRVLIVSCDSHAGPTPDAARSYFERKYDDDLQRYEDETDNYGRVLNAFLAGAMDPDAMSETMTVVDPEGIIASGGQLGAYDPQRRLLEMDREGVAAEVLLIGHQLAPPPFCGVVNTPYPAELRAAGTAAYHRWLVDHVAADPKRLLGVAEAGPCLDMDATVKELRWVAEHGFIAAHLPGTVYDAALPPLYDPYFEPYWSTCAELGLTLLIHVGYGKPQGETINFLAKCAEVATNAQNDASGGSLKMVEEMINSPDSPFAPDLVPRRAIWQLMLSGVFDRHPGLKLQVTEMRADWVPATLAALDRRFEEDETPLSMKPSDYWKRNCFTCPSSIHRSEVAMRDEIGVSQMLFGRDYPHPESTWPNTRDWIRDAFVCRARGRDQDDPGRKRRAMPPTPRPRQPPEDRGARGSPLRRDLRDQRSGQRRPARNLRYEGGLPKGTRNRRPPGVGAAVRGGPAGRVGCCGSPRAGRRMKFGLQLAGLNPSLGADVAEEADRLGFESVWIPEHLVVPIAATGSPFKGSDEPGIPSGFPFLDPFAYLGYLAARTTRILLGTNVYNVGLRHPFATARAATTVDVVSGGRLALGIGAGWLREEWEAVGLDFDRRGAVVDEAIEVCRRLWSEEVVEHKGEFFEFGPLAFEPKPVQRPGPALHIGGDGPAALRRAATVGTGWMPMNHGRRRAGRAHRPADGDLRSLRSEHTGRGDTRGRRGPTRGCGAVCQGRRLTFDRPSLAAVEGGARGDPAVRRRGPGPAAVTSMEPADLDLTDDQQLLGETTARFIESTCPLTRIRELSEGGTDPGPDYRRSAAELGWFAMLAPEELGGGSVSGNGVVDAAIIAEARGRLLQPGAFAATNAVVCGLSIDGSPDLQTKLVPAIVVGRCDGDVGVGRPVRIAGQRSSSRNAAAPASSCPAWRAWFRMPTAATGCSSPRRATPVPASSCCRLKLRGMAVRRLDGLDLTRRFCVVQFDEVELPGSALVGEVGGAGAAIERQLQVALALTVAESVGAMSYDLELVVEYAKARIAFGRPIGSFQAVKHLLADTSLLLEASKAMSAACARAVGSRSDEGAAVASMAKAFVGDCGIELAQNCLQVFGGIGFTWEHDQHLYLRRLTTDAALYGDPSWHRERLCRLHGV